MEQIISDTIGQILNNIEENQQLKSDDVEEDQKPMSNADEDQKPMSDAADDQKPMLEADEDQRLTSDAEANLKKYSYPKSIILIIGNEFCERFNYYGMRTVLVLYLTRKLLYDDDTASIIYHTFTVFCYFFPIFGGILCDSWLGKFRTILYLSILYAIGSILMSITAMPPFRFPEREFIIFSLFLISIGSGGIKPCVSAFGGDQFKLPEQAKHMITFFSVFYFAINAGSMISSAITPILREDVKCFGQDDCYSLAFGVPGILMVVAILLFFGGKKLYVITEPSGNMLIKVSRCISTAISTKIRERKTNSQAHWLDYSIVKHGQQLVNETKVLLNILILYIPLPVFWALFDQQGSRWTFQATRMNGIVGRYEIKPDQMQVVNPLLILVFIPLYDVVFYPLLSKIGIRRPLQKLTLGGILGGVAFLCSGFVELALEATYPILPSVGESQLRIFNGLPCEYIIRTNMTGDNTEFALEGMSVFQDRYISVTDTTSYTYVMTPIPDDSQNCSTFRGNFNLKSETAMSYFMTDASTVMGYEDKSNKSTTGDPMLRILVNSPSVRKLMVVDILHPDRLVRFKGKTDENELIQLQSSTYEITIDDYVLPEYSITQGAVNTLIVREVSANDFKSTNVEIVLPNSIHMLWQVPQYAIMTLAEVMFSVTGLSFSYAEAPTSMKSVLQSCWLVTVAFGNIIDIFVIESKIFATQASEFFLVAGLMFVDMGIFMLLAYRYKSITASSEKEKLINNLSDKRYQENENSSTSASK